MQITVEKIILQNEKNRVLVRFFDEIATWHQGCEVTVFLDVEPNQTIEEVSQKAIRAAKEFLSKGLNPHL